MRLARVLGFCVLLVSLGMSFAVAGPPYFTDDPVPVEYHHWEVYLASQYLKIDEDRTETAPHTEINYGPISNLQLHMQAAAVLNRPADGPSTYGFGDMEFGAKYRFLQESQDRPQAALYPLIEVPTGDADRGLGNGNAQFFIPIWLQKSWGPWTTDGGGGYWINPGVDHQNGGFVGGMLQRDLSKTLTVGAEVFHRSGETVNGPTGTGFTIGLQANFSEYTHLLFSAGRDFSGPEQLTRYLALQWTF